MPLSLQECRTKFPDVALTETKIGAHAFVHRAMRPREFRKYTASAASAMQLQKDMSILFAANEEVCIDCCVSHNPQELADIFDAGMITLWDKLADAILTIARKDFESRGKG